MCIEHYLRGSSIPSPISPPTAHGRACVICLDSDANMFLVTCGHVVLCAGCAPKLAAPERPVCRKAFSAGSDLLRAYI